MLCQHQLSWACQHACQCSLSKADSVPDKCNVSCGNQNWRLFAKFHCKTIFQALSQNWSGNTLFYGLFVIHPRYVWPAQYLATIFSQCPSCSQCCSTSSLFQLDNFLKALPDISDDICVVSEHSPCCCFVCHLKAAPIETGWFYFWLPLCSSFCVFGCISWKGQSACVKNLLHLQFDWLVNDFPCNIKWWVRSSRLNVLYFRQAIPNELSCHQCNQ